MKIDELVDRLQRLPEGGIMTSENRFDYEYCVSVWNTYRAFFIQETYAKNKRINPICYQKYHPTYEKDFQDNNGCYVKFFCPNVISLDDKSDGLRYVGTDPVKTGMSNGFKRVQSRSWLSTYNNHSVTNVNNSRAVYYLLDGQMQTMELYGNGTFIKVPPLIEGLFADPTVIPTWNKDYDPYPIDDDSVPEIEEMIYTAHTRIVEGTSPTPAFTQSYQPRPAAKRR